MSIYRRICITCIKLTNAVPFITIPHPTHLKTLHANEIFCYDYQFYEKYICQLVFDVE